MFIPLKSCAVTRSLANNEVGLPRVSPIRVKRLQIRVRGLFKKNTGSIHLQKAAVFVKTDLSDSGTYIFENNDRLFEFGYPHTHQFALL